MAYRLVGAGSTSGYNPKVPVTATPGNVTSSHIALAAGVTAKNVVWGNGALGFGGSRPDARVRDGMHGLPQPARERQLPDPQ